MVLKIIGVIVAVILGLCLLLLLAALLVPVRYRLTGSFRESFKGTVRVSWLLHIFSARISWGETMTRTIRILGIPVIRSGGGRDGKAPKKLGKRKSKKSRKRRPEGKKDPESGAGKQEHPDGRDRGAEEEPAIPEEWEVLQTQELRGEADAVGPSSSGNRNAAGNPFSEALKFLKGLPGRLKQAFERILDRIRAILRKLKDLETAVFAAKAWLEDPANQRMMRKLWKQGKAFLFHVIPRRMKGTVTIGFEDPADTGKALAVAGLLCPFYGNRIQVIPSFDQPVFCAEGSIRGRIRFGTLMWLLFGAYRDKTFQALIKKWFR